MVKKAAQNEPFVKKKIYADLAVRTGRSEKSIELRMQNISHVVGELDRQWLKGLTPAANVGAKVTSRLASLLKTNPDFQLLEPLEAIAYQLKLPAIREWLIRVAQAQSTVFYGDLMAAFDVGRFNLRRVMDRIGHEAQQNGEPILTALIINKETGRCSEGLEHEFDVHDDEAERQALYAYWQNRERDPSSPESLASSDVPLKLRAARFASVEIRPSQAAFRRKVFERFQGMCAISGCSVEKALDAAHLQGRKWRLGHNEAADGVLLRKDLHALYDNGLLSISESGVVSLSQVIIADYAAFDGYHVKKWSVGGM
jgi:hypothetical protein